MTGLARWRTWAQRPRQRPVTPTGTAHTILIRALIIASLAALAATVVGFWLSYANLHTIAVRAGLPRVEAWAFPASIDLFIIVGEAGILISAIRHVRDPLAWFYLAAGFLPSVLFNVLHVAAFAPWERYAIAAVPPVAAMLALAALMRQVFRFAADAPRQFSPAPFTDAQSAAAEAYRRSVAGGNPYTVNGLAGKFRITRPEAARVAERVMAESNGHGKREEVPS